MKKSNILVIGGTGFLGSHLVAKLLEKNYNVRVFSRGNLKSVYRYDNVEYIEGDLQKNYLLNKALRRIDYVYYFASTTNPKSSENDLIFDSSSNLIPLIALLNMCVENNIKKFIFCSSGGAIYGNTSALPISEDVICNPISSYGLVKLSMEMYIKYFNRKYNLRYEILRLSNPYGVNKISNVSKGIIPTFIKSIVLNQKIKVFGDGEIIRDYIYIDDFINLNLKLLTIKEKNNTMNIGSGVGISINQLINKIESSIGKKALIDYLPSREFDVHKNILKINKVKDVYKWEPTTILDDGIKKISDWLKL